jgi:hypothetical protein
VYCMMMAPPPHAREGLIAYLGTSEGHIRRVYCGDVNDLLTYNLDCHSEMKSTGG